MNALLLAAEAPLPDAIALPEWAQWVVLFSILAAAVRGLWIKVVQPISRTLVLMENVTPTLQEIAHHFKPNGGSSLYDVVTDTRNDLTDLTTKVDALTAEQHRLDQIVSPAVESPSVTVDRIDRLKELIADAVEEALRDDPIAS